jgi:hypothetical protein
MEIGAIHRGSARGALLAAALVAVGCGDKAAREATVLATVPGAPGGLTVDARYAYFTVTAAPEGGGAVMRVELEGGALDPLIEEQAWPFDVLLLGSNLYWTNRGSGAGDGEVMTAPAAGGTAVPLAQQQLGPRSLALLEGAAGPTLCWADLDEAATIGRLMQRAISGGGDGTAVAAGTVQRPEGVAGGVDAVYWTEPTTGDVWALPDMATAAVPVASSQDRPRGLVTDSEYVYWTTAGSKAGADGAVWRAPHGTAAAVQVVGQQNVGGLGRLALDSERVYWLNVDGADHALMAAPLGGGAAEMIAVGPGGQVFDVAVDDQRVYWTASDGVDGRVLSVEKR